MSDLPTRFEELETLCTHQRRELDSLNETVCEQWRKIDELGKIVARLQEHLKQMGTDLPSEDSPPPHY